MSMWDEIVFRIQRLEMEAAAKKAKYDHSAKRQANAKLHANRVDYATPIHKKDRWFLFADEAGKVERSITKQVSDNVYHNDYLNVWESRYGITDSAIARKAFKNVRGYSGSGIKTQNEIFYFRGKLNMSKRMLALTTTDGESVQCTECNGFSLADWEKVIDNASVKGYRPLGLFIDGLLVCGTDIVKPDSFWRQKVYREEYDELQWVAGPEIVEYPADKVITKSKNDVMIMLAKYVN